MHTIILWPDVCLAILAQPDNVSCNKAVLMLCPHVACYRAMIVQTNSIFVYRILKLIIRV